MKTSTLAPTGSPEAATGVEGPLHIPPPRHRIFLPQTFAERSKSFWWSVVRNTLFRLSPPPVRRWRILLLRMFGAKVGRNVYISGSARIDSPWNLVIGDGVVICEHVIINCMGKVTIGDRTRISQYSHLCAGTHDYERRDMTIMRCPISIGSDVWIAADAFVGPGVTIGDGCLLAARSSTFRNLPSAHICLGEPARPTRSRELRSR